MTGTGRAKGAPDTVTLYMGARAKPRPRKALRIVSEKARLAARRVRRGWCPQEDIQTSNVSLCPTYNQNGQQIDGYTAENTVTVTVRDVDQAGPVIGAASGAVGDELTLSGIAFSIDDPEPLRTEARGDAVAQARAQAEQLAGLAGGEVGEVLAITDGSVQMPIPLVYRSAAGAEEAAQDAAMPIEPGSQEVTADGDGDLRTT